MNTNEWLCAVCSSPRSMSHFIALLAELEGIGAHKIRCCVEENHWGERERKHLGEETKHATVFEKFLQHPQWALLATEREQMRELAHDYFEPLDHGTADHLNGLISGYSPRLCYGLVSYIIECRALEVYRSLLVHCPYEELHRAIQQIVSDEEVHLIAARQEIERIFAELDHVFQEEEFKDLEERLYVGLQKRFMAAVLPAPAGSSVVA